MAQLICEKFLQENGIKYEKTPEGLLIFSYQGGNFIITNDEKDELFLQILMPGIYNENSPANKSKILSVLNDLNREMKIAKARYEPDNTVWLAIEMFIDRTPDLKDFFFRVMDILHETRMRFVNKMSNI
ncbi:MAG: YbjN domain-containing protein [Rikenellaceae bacterium]|nr:YbjN domain-containing protein [Rikenellaceae bacterium]MCL2692017.1 YbjN domain-containing protein [Rikenellaceae bacterium]